MQPCYSASLWIQSCRETGPAPRMKSGLHRRSRSWPPCRCRFTAAVTPDQKTTHRERAEAAETAAHAPIKILQQHPSLQRRHEQHNSSSKAVPFAGRTAAAGRRRGVTRAQLRSRSAASDARRHAAQRSVEPTPGVKSSVLLGVSTAPPQRTFMLSTSRQPLTEDTQNQPPPSLRLWRRQPRLSPSTFSRDHANHHGRSLLSVSVSVSLSLSAASAPPQPSFHGERTEKQKRSVDHGATRMRIDDTHYSHTRASNRAMKKGGGALVPSLPRYVCVLPNS